MPKTSDVARKITNAQVKMQKIVKFYVFFIKNCAENHEKRIYSVFFTAD